MGRNRAFSTRVGSILISSAVAVAVACGSESGTNTGTTDAGGSSSGASSGTTSSGGSSSGSSGTSSSGSSGSDASSGGEAGFDANSDAADSTCATLTKAQCRQCCGVGHTAGRQAYDKAFTACVCTADRCHSACSQSVCATPANPGESAACTTCLGDQTGAGDPCERSKIQTATDCTAAADCAGYITCLNGCP